MEAEFYFLDAPNVSSADHRLRTLFSDRCLSKIKYLIYVYFYEGCHDALEIDTCFYQGVKERAGMFQK